MYITELESRIKEIQKENFRLQSLLCMYRKDQWSNLSAESKTLVEGISVDKSEIFTAFMDYKSGKYNENTEYTMKEHFAAHNPKIMKKHKKFLDHIFDLVLENFDPVCKFSYWKYLDEDYKPRFELIKK
mmetsp:Transcript_4818/g.4068  ORF Transcript_4818/g.4068 Transcript_4818/m.4068 type:complete len:129 (+) Transcript_4818:170-556(+)